MDSNSIIIKVEFGDKKLKSKIEDLNITF